MIERSGPTERLALANCRYEATKAYGTVCLSNIQARVKSAQLYQGGEAKLGLYSRILRDVAPESVLFQLTDVRRVPIRKVAAQSAREAA